MIVRESRSQGAWMNLSCWVIILRYYGSRQKPSPLSKKNFSWNVLLCNFIHVVVVLYVAATRLSPLAKWMRYNELVGLSGIADNDQVTAVTCNVVGFYIKLRWVQLKALLVFLRAWGAVNSLYESFLLLPSLVMSLTTVNIKSVRTSLV